MRKAALPIGIALALALYAWFGTFREATTPVKPTPAPPEEGCTLLGQVLDSEGAPLPNATVRARIVTPGTAHESLPVDTGEDGSFALRLFPARGRWSVLIQPAGRPGFTAGTLVTAVPDETVRITIREPAGPPPEEEPPNLAGEAMDGNGRMLACVVVVKTVDGELLGRLPCEGGRFSGHFDSEEVIAVSIESIPGSEQKIGRLPRLNVKLIPRIEGPERGEIIIDFLLPAAIPNDEARIRLYSDLGFMVLEVWRGVREAPHALIGQLYGVYDIRVDVPGYAGALQGFEFRPDKRVATVTLGPAAKIRGSLSRDARCLLFSRSPSLARLGSTITEDDGVAGRYRGLWEEKPAARAFAFDGLPGGKYRLRILARGVETVDRNIELKSGQDLDLGRIDLEEATGAITLRIRDRKQPEDVSVEFGYLVHLYEVGGLCLSRSVRAESLGEAVFQRLPAGPYRYRVERRMKDASHTRYVGSDKRVELKKGAKVRVAVDCTWRY